MGFRYCFLILLFAGSVSAAPLKSKNYCLKCHSSHFVEVAGCVDCHRGFAGTERINIAHQGLLRARFSTFTLPTDPVTQQGLNLFEGYACRRCHTSAQKGNRLAANLDLSQFEKTPEELEDSIKSPVLFMPVFHFTEKQLTALLNAILRGGIDFVMPQHETPEVIHFEGEVVTREFQFEKHCGTCHRILSADFGGLGEGLIGPNLSGIFSPFYPKNYGEESRSWDREGLKKWLNNPRKIRPFTQMAPVDLKEHEFDQVCAELEHSALKK